MPTELPAGYHPYGYGDPFEDCVGPLGYKVDAGRISFVFEAQPHHRDSSDSLHGGMLMTFADYAVCLTAVWDQLGEKCVTVSFNCEFVSASVSSTASGQHDGHITPSARFSACGRRTFYHGN